MTWTGSSGQTYDLALLDTNALSEIVKYPEKERKGFLTLFASRPLAPCFTPYNLAELYRAPGVFEGFVDFFSGLPVFMTMPWDMVLDLELQCFDGGPAVSPLLNAFTPDGPAPSFDLRCTLESVFADPMLKAVINSNGDPDASAMEVLQTWLGNKKNFQPSSPVANSADAKRFVAESGVQSLISLHPQWMKAQLDLGGVPDVHAFPSVATMLYSQYWRFWDPSWMPAPGDVVDIQIMAVAPYMDVVVTEKRQAEIFRKIKDLVPGLDSLSVLRVRDLRGGEV